MGNFFCSAMLWCISALKKQKKSCLSTYCLFLLRRLSKLEVSTDNWILGLFLVHISIVLLYNIVYKTIERRTRKVPRTQSSSDSSAFSVLFFLWKLEVFGLKPDLSSKLNLSAKIHTTLLKYLFWIQKIEKSCTKGFTIHFSKKVRLKTS